MPMKKVFSVEASETNLSIVTPSRNFPDASSPSVDTLIAQAKLSKEADLDAAYTCLERKNLFFRKVYYHFLKNFQLKKQQI
jgi:hypothetical protein